MDASEEELDIFPEPEDPRNLSRDESDVGGEYFLRDSPPEERFGKTPPRVQSSHSLFGEAVLSGPQSHHAPSCPEEMIQCPILLDPNSKSLILEDEVNEEQEIVDASPHQDRNWVLSPPGGLSPSSQTSFDCRLSPKSQLTTPPSTIHPPSLSPPPLHQPTIEPTDPPLTSFIGSSRISVSTTASRPRPSRPPRAPSNRANNNISSSISSVVHNRNASGDASFLSALTADSVFTRPGEILESLQQPFLEDNHTDDGYEHELRQREDPQTPRREFEGVARAALTMAQFTPPTITPIRNNSYTPLTVSNSDDGTMDDDFDANVNEETHKKDPMELAYSLLSQLREGRALNMAVVVSFVVPVLLIVALMQLLSQHTCLVLGLLSLGWLIYQSERCRRRTTFQPAVDELGRKLEALLVVMGRSGTFMDRLDLPNTDPTTLDTTFNQDPLKTIKTFETKLERIRREVGRIRRTDELQRQLSEIYGKLRNRQLDGDSLTFATICEVSDALTDDHIQVLKAIFRPGTNDIVDTKDFIQRSTRLVEDLEGLTRAVATFDSLSFQFFALLVAMTSAFVGAVAADVPSELVIGALIGSCTLAYPVFHGMIFICVCRTYELGDHMVISPLRTTSRNIDWTTLWKVEDITMFHTQLKSAITDDTLKLPNSELAKMGVCNRGQGAAVVRIPVFFESNATLEAIESFRRSLSAFVADQPHLYRKCEFRKRRFHNTRLEFEAELHTLAQWGTDEARACEFDILAFCHELQNLLKGSKSHGDNLTKSPVLSNSSPLMMPEGFLRPR